MRFYHLDGTDRKYATKCIRVSNKDSTKNVVDMLATKFRPDMRMLTTPKYALYEVHEDAGMSLILLLIFVCGIHLVFY